MSVQSGNKLSTHPYILVWISPSQMLQMVWDWSFFRLILFTLPNVAEQQCRIAKWPHKSAYTRFHPLKCNRYAAKIRITKQGSFWLFREKIEKSRHFEFKLFYNRFIISLSDWFNNKCQESLSWAGTLFWNIILVFHWKPITKTQVCAMQKLCTAFHLISLGQATLTQHLHKVWWIW